MLVKDLRDNHGFLPVAGEKFLDKEIKNAYIGDLLSWVMGNAKEGCAWITIQGHLNIVAVANLVETACIVVCEGAQVTPETIEKANEEELPILTTKLNSYEVAKLFAKENI